MSEEEATARDPSASDEEIPGSPNKEEATTDADATREEATTDGDGATGLEKGLEKDLDKLLESGIAAATNASTAPSLTKEMSELCKQHRLPEDFCEFLLQNEVLSETQFANITDCEANLQKDVFDECGLNLKIKDRANIRIAWKKARAITDAEASEALSRKRQVATMPLPMTPPKIPRTDLLGASTPEKNRAKKKMSMYRF